MKKRVILLSVMIFISGAVCFNSYLITQLKNTASEMQSHITELQRGNSRLQEHISILQDKLIVAQTEIEEIKK